MSATSWAGSGAYKHEVTYLARNRTSQPLTFTLSGVTLSAPGRERAEGRFASGLEAETIAPPQTSTRYTTVKGEKGLRSVTLPLDPHVFAADEPQRPYGNVQQAVTLNPCR